VNAHAQIVRSASPIRLDDASIVEGKRVLVVEDGPTITHGGMPYGAGFLAARNAGAVIVDPRGSAPPQLQKLFDTYPHIGNVLPAVGYDSAQLSDLETAINNSAADIVVSATPIDLQQSLKLNKTVVGARYEFAETGEPKLSGIVAAFIERVCLSRSGR
jgi:predicted GTPase